MGTLRGWVRCELFLAYFGGKFLSVKAMETDYFCLSVFFLAVPFLRCVWLRARRSLASCLLSKSQTRRRSKEKKIPQKMKLRSSEGKSRFVFVLHQFAVGKCVRTSKLLLVYCRSLAVFRRQPEKQRNAEKHYRCRSCIILACNIQRFNYVCFQCA